MAEMSDEEALKILTRGMEGGIYEDIGKAFCRAMNALAGSVAREREAKKPKRPSLKECIKELEDRCATIAYDKDHVGEMYPGTRRAVDIIRALDEDVIPWLKASVETNGNLGALYLVRGQLMSARSLLEVLGEEVP